ncbi:alpha/beta hydrolase family protein [Chitinophaga rhizosphaerae]|uniref:alpha/beta hydrolase family protein n=1 Tax=Chitinophaga rhizosphaerae TaxID=1864947 RepID=UPI000F7FDD20|nr:alpha/beta fold hydrolase [Chitinophaga rhizosphaerae]
MSTKSLQIKVSPEIGKVSAKYVSPAHPVCVMTLAHGAGAGMDHPFMEALAESLSKAGIATLRFNFPFTEQQKKRPDSPAVAQAAIAAAIEKAGALAPGIPLFASGKSFGGRMTSQYISSHPDSPVKGIVFFGFPLHPAGKPSIDRAEHLHQIHIPMLFLQGSKDTLATWDMIASVCKSLSTATLEKFEGADHSFKAGKTDVISLLAAAAKAWTVQQL